MRERLKALRDHDERAAVEMRKAYDTLDEVLDVRQQARFRIFEETIERRKLDSWSGLASGRAGPGVAAELVSAASDRSGGSTIARRR